MYNFVMIGLDVCAFLGLRCLVAFQQQLDRLICYFTRGARLKKRKLREAMRKSLSYHEWMYHANELDILEGNDQWRAKHESTAYDFAVVSGQLQRLRQLRKSGRTEELLFALRAILSRSYAGLNSKELFASSHIGTKHLIEEFQQEIRVSLLHVSNHESISRARKTNFFQLATHSYGRTALCLSGGGALTMYHMGIVRGLIREKTMPRVVSGTSGGSIVAGMLARYKDEEMLDWVLKPNISNKYGVRWFEPFIVQLKHFIVNGTLTNSEQFARTCRAYYGDITFAEAYRHTRRIVSICVTCRNASGSHPLLLNYLTTPHVLLWSAVQASCALPGLMKAVELMARKPKTKEVVPYLPGQVIADGSIHADLPMQRLAELFSVNNFIVSQVNPHVSPFISSGEIDTAARQSGARSLTKAVEYMLNLDVQHRCRKLAKIGLFPRVFGQNMSGVFVQRYVGNVTIAPRLSVMDNFRAIQHPTEKDMRRYLAVGSQALYPKVETIQHQMLVEQCLETCTRRWKADEGSMGSRTSISTAPFSGADIPAAARRQEVESNPEPLISD